MHTDLVRKPEWKRPPGRPRNRSDMKQMHVKEIGLEEVDFIYLVQGRDQWQGISSLAEQLLASMSIVQHSNEK